MSFTHLHVHTEYSLLDGSNKIKEYVKRVKELGMNSAAITDHGVMYGAIDFYRECKANGINPILGCEVYVAPGSRFDKEKGGDERYHHLILLAENNTGYQNLIKIVSKGFTEGYYYKPRVDFEVISKYHEGLICCSACLAGEIPRYIMRGLVDEAKKVAIKYRDLFGPGNFFLELQDHGIPEQRTVNSVLLNLSEELGIPLVATNDVHYTYESDVESHDILLCIQTAKLVTDEDRMRYEGGQYFVKSEEEMRSLFPYALEAIENTQKIADRCHVEIEFGNYKLPHYEVPDGHTSLSYLRYLCEKGLKERYGDDSVLIAGTNQTLKDRLDYELNIISTMGFVDYFLIVWDFINYSKENDIPVGPGRGSAAGSIVAYCLKITDIDPIKYQLLFERFLNPERVSMPDIDIDFCYTNRHKVIEYVSKKYGAEKVVQIVTFGTLQAKGVIRDVGRAMDLPYSYVDSIAKMIPNELNITLEKAIEMNPELKKLYFEDDTVKHLIDMCKCLEGLPRHSSMHAAGVVICPKAADEFVPLSRGADGSITTQFTMTTLEELGLLKMDFLGLRTLTVLKDACGLISKNRGININLSTIDYNDKEVYADIGAGKTEGVFQLESAGMRSFMKELKPECLEDIIAGVALYRPGPMDFIPKYIKGKNSGEKVVYSCPELEPILSNTYGCIVYQEQVMQIVRDLGGYTLGRSDLVRRAMSKKKQAVMEKERQNFIYGNEAEQVPGCISRGITEAVAGQIYDEMMDFAKYAFNKSHAACYAVVAFQTAYLKHYYPVEYMAALLTSFIDNTAKVSSYIMVARNMGIKLLPPDVNSGSSDFSVDKDSIRYALGAIKNIGTNCMDAMVREREENGQFTDIKSFISRCINLDVNKRTVENLIKAGAMDGFGANRRQLLMIFESLIDAENKEKKHSFQGQMSLFDMMGDEERIKYQISLPDVEEYEKSQLLAYEKEVLGIYISGHPLEKQEKMWRKNITNTMADFILDEDTGVTLVQDNSLATIGGMINDIKTKYTKNDQIMAFVQMEDLVGSTEVIVFPKTYEKYQRLLHEDEKIFVKGRVQAEEDKDAKMIAQEILSFDDIAGKLWIKFDDMKQYTDLQAQVMKLIGTYPGKDNVTLYISETKQMKALPNRFNVNGKSNIKDELINLLGEERVKFVV